MDIIDTLKQDYQRFPVNQSYHLYAPDVYFRDPLNEFRGLERYKQTIQFIQTWFADVKMDLHDIHCEENLITTRWTLRWNSPLPWKPRVAISGRSELRLNEEGLVASHIDYWDCSVWDVAKQHFSR